MNHSHALLILGMHRSGTSALTGALALRGVHLGHDLMPPAEGNNRKGFWEHMGVVNIHEQLLEALGHPWHQPGPLPAAWLHHPATATAREQLRALIQAEFLPHPVWAVKDPRLCRLLPLWRPLLDEMNITTSAVVIARDPREVADSLQKRDRIAPKASRELWLWYLADALHDSLDLPRCALTYPRLLADPAGEIEALAESLHLPLAAAGAAVAEHFSDFIEAGERHCHAHTGIAPEWELAVSIYRKLLHQPVPWDDIYTIALANTQTGLPLAHALDDYARLRDRQRRTLDATQHALVSTHQELNRIWHQFNKSQQALHHTEKEYERTRQECDVTGQALDRTRQELERIRQERDDARQAFSHTTQELDNRTAWARELDSTLQDILTSRSWRWTKPLRGMERILRRQSPFSASPPPAPVREETAVVVDAVPAVPTASSNSNTAAIACLRADGNARGYVRDDSKLIAFYLPQYHWVAENSQWWGQGFTEWTNVVRAQPNFEGHDQPHLPGELDLYDLDDVEVIRDQATLAKEYGIHGFCFYYYWFSGQRILERPLDNVLASDIDMPFCLCWANENWTRTWDGGERHILLEQGYAPGDEERFIEDIYPFLADSRYIRVNDKPMLLVYRIKAFPDPKTSTEKWQQAAKRLGLPGLHLVAVDFVDMDDNDNPREMGLDALVEFPPHKYGNKNTLADTWPPMTNPEFRGCFYEYPAMALHGILRQTPDFPLYRGIIPGWDNTARRQNNGLTVLHSSPEYFALWLQFLRVWTRDVHRHDKAPFIFVNAWNEWGEGCHLEPDLHWGLAYLDEILRSSHLPPKAQNALQEVRDWSLQQIRNISARDHIVLPST